MKRVIGLAIVAVLVAGAGWTVYWSLGTCQPLDRLLGLSGCRGSVALTGVAPLSGQTLSVPGEDGVSSLFGWVRTADGTRAGMVRLDPATGGELGRFPLRAQIAFSHVQFANDGERALMTCAVEDTCTETGQKASIVSLADGTEIERLDDFGAAGFNVPGDPVPGPDFQYGAILADAGRSVVSREGANLPRLYRIDGSEIADLFGPDERIDFRLDHVSVSPTGRYIALAAASIPTPSGDTIFIWDGRSGERIQTIETGAGYHVRSQLTWSHDETELFAIRRDGPHTIIDRFTAKTVELSGQ